MKRANYDDTYLWIILTFTVMLHKYDSFYFKHQGLVVVHQSLQLKNVNFIRKENVAKEM